MRPTIIYRTYQLQSEMQQKKMTKETMTKTRGKNHQLS